MLGHSWFRCTSRMSPYAGILCIVMVPVLALRIDSQVRNCLVVDEGYHLVSGLRAWNDGTINTYFVNPPLIRLLTSLPVYLSRHHYPRDMRSNDALRELIALNGQRFWHLLLYARLVNTGLFLSGTWLVYRLASDIFNVRAGFVAALLWASCPNISTMCDFVTCDLGASVFGLAAVYAFHCYVRCPTFLSATVAGWVLGLAELSKFTLLVLYPFLVFAWGFWYLIGNWRSPSSGAARMRFAHLIMMLLISLMAIGFFYAFQGMGRTLGSYEFDSALLTVERNQKRVNRFEDGWLGRFPVPLPALFVIGLDAQKADADVGRPAYLRGEWKHGGWWYYYLYALLVKLPLGTLVLIVLSALLILCSARFRGRVREELLWAGPAAAVFLLITSETGINSHLRYILPMLPFLFIGISRVGLLLPTTVNWRSTKAPVASLFGALVVALALFHNGLDVARIHPHYLSYFNELAGGPDHGWHHLLESNIDWGQDLFFLRDWLHDHPEARPLRLAYYGGTDPHLLGIQYDLPPNEEDTPQSGWFAVSVNFIGGAGFTGYDGEGNPTSFRPGAFQYFQHFTPVAKAGYSIFIYHVTSEEVNRSYSRIEQP